MFGVSVASIFSIEADPPDFGAASNYTSLSPTNAAAMQSVEVRAFGCLLEDFPSPF